MKYKGLLVSVLLLCLVWGQAFGATYYVDPTCSVAGNGTTETCTGAGGTSPFTGLTTPTSNNTYLFKSGTTLTKTTYINIDTVTNVTLGIYGGTERATIHNTSTSGLFALRIHDSTNITIGDLTFRSTAETQTYCAAIYVDETVTTGTTSNIDFNNVRVYGSPQGLAIHKNVDDVTVTGGDYSDNTFSAAASIALSGLNSSGILVAGASNVVIDGVTASRNGLTVSAFDPGQGEYINEGRGITIQDESSIASTYVTVTDSELVDNGDRIGEEGSGIEGANAQYVTIERNFISGSTAFEVKRSSNFWTVRSNIMVGASSSVLQYGYYTSDSTGSTFENNTIVGTRPAGSAYQVLFGITSASACVSCKNNTLVYAGGMDSDDAVGFQLGRSGWVSADLDTFDSVLDYNNVYGANSAKRVETVTGSSVYTDYTLAAWQAAQPTQAVNDLAVAPAFVGGASPTTAAGFKPKKGSALRRAGKGLGIPVRDYAGRPFYPSAPSIGAYEVTSNSEATDRTTAAARTARN